MRFCAGQAGTQLAFFARFCTTRRATNRQGQFLFGFHGLHNAPLLANKMVNSDQCFDARMSIFLTGEIMTTIKFVVRVNHGANRAPAYVQRIDRTPVQMTTDRKLALMMGRFTAEDAAKSLQNSRCIPELVPVQVIA